MIDKKLYYFVGLTLLLFARVSYADSIGGLFPCNSSSFSGSCDGAMYTLHYSGSALPDADPLHETFRITLDIDTNTYTGGGTYLDNVAIKVSSSVFAFSLYDAPGGVGNWGVFAGGLNANGCSGSGSGDNCTDGTANGGKGVAVTTGNGIGTDYSFVFDVTVDNGELFVLADQASIKARYLGLKKGVYEKMGALLSENITLQSPPSVPEPASLLLLGLGLMGLAGMRRRMSA